MKLSAQKQNLIFALLILAVSGILFATQIFGGASNGLSDIYAEVHVSGSDGNTVINYSLDEDATYDIETESGYTVHLQVEDGAISFVDSPCPDHVCESFGCLSDENAFAVCAPAGVTILLAANQ